MGLGAVIKIYPERVAENPIAIWVSAIVAVISFVALLLILKWSYRPININSKYSYSDSIVSFFVRY